MAFLSFDLKENITVFDAIFKDCGDVIQLDLNLEYLNNADGKIYFVESAVSKVNLKRVILGLSDVFPLYTKEEVISAIMTGNAVLFVDGQNYAYKIRSAGFPGLGVQEASDEKVLRGSNEGFSDSYKTNQALIRKRIRDPELKIEEQQIGRRTQTGIALLYMETIVRKPVLDEVKRRLHAFEIDGVLDSGILEQLTCDAPYSPFPQYLTTQRPDKATLALLNGHVVILVDNSPFALILPVQFASFLKAADDYYTRFEVASFVRLLRYIAIFFAVSLPALYIAVMNFHPELLPPDLISIFASSRDGIPYPVVVEVLVMEIAFELIREAGVRIPGAIGNTIGIVGGLIVGSAAVDASLASPIIVIVVAMTALCSFTIPNNEFSATFRLLKYYLIVWAAFLGMYGYMLGVFSILIHLSGLKSYGFPYLGPMAAGETEHYQGEKDFVLRAPLHKMIFRNRFSTDKNRRRFRI